MVVEDIAKLNQLLRVSNQESAVLLTSLEKLSQKLPSREILRSTKIGCCVDTIVLLLMLCAVVGTTFH